MSACSVVMIWAVLARTIHARSKYSYDSSSDFLGVRALFNLEIGTNNNAVGENTCMFPFSIFSGKCMENMLKRGKQSFFLSNKIAEIHCTVEKRVCIRLLCDDILGMVKSSPGGVFGVHATNGSIHGNTRSY